jgi:hypothetical protein
MHFPQKQYSAFFFSCRNSSNYQKSVVGEKINAPKENIAQFGDESVNVKSGEVTVNMVSVAINIMISLRTKPG